MQLTTETAKKLLAMRCRDPKKNKCYMRGCYHVTYTLNRKNGKRHLCYRSDSIRDCIKWINQQKYTDRYYNIWDYRWNNVLDTRKPDERNTKDAKQDKHTKEYWNISVKEDT